MSFIQYLLLQPLVFSSSDLRHCFPAVRHCFILYIRGGPSKFECCILPQSSRALMWSMVCCTCTHGWMPPHTGTLAQRAGMDLIRKLGKLRTFDEGKELWMYICLVSCWHSQLLHNILNLFPKPFTKVLWDLDTFFFSDARDWDERANIQSSHSESILKHFQPKSMH